MGATPARGVNSKLPLRFAHTCEEKVAAAARQHGAGVDNGDHGQLSPDAQRLRGRESLRPSLGRRNLRHAKPVQVHPALEHDVGHLMALDHPQRSAVDHVATFEELQGESDAPLRR